MVRAPVVRSPEGFYGARAGSQPGRVLQLKARLGEWETLPPSRGPVEGVSRGEPPGAAGGDHGGWLSFSVTIGGGSASPQSAAPVLAAPRPVLPVPARPCLCLSVLPVLLVPASPDCPCLPCPYLPARTGSLSASEVVHRWQGVNTHLLGAASSRSPDPLIFHKEGESCLQLEMGEERRFSRTNPVSFPASQIWKGLPGYPPSPIWMADSV